MAWYVRVLRRSSAARFTVLAKRGCLLVAVIQNSFGVMWFRYSRITPECRDDPAAVVVLYGEILKLGACLFFLLMLRGPKGLHTELREKIWDRPLDTLKLSIPSGCYAIGNNLQFMAAQNLSAVMIHVLERSKVLCTACLGMDPDTKVIEDPRRVLNSDETPQPIDAPQKGRRPKVAKREGMPARSATTTSKDILSVNMTTLCRCASTAACAGWSRARWPSGSGALSAGPRAACARSGPARPRASPCCWATTQLCPSCRRPVFSMGRGAYIAP